MLALAFLTIQRARHRDRDDAYRLQQHHWRALHQTRATVSHYDCRRDPLPDRLKPWHRNGSYRSPSHGLRL